MKYLLSAFLLALSFVPLAARADMIPEGYHPIVSVVYIDNTSEFSGYDFYLTGAFHAGGALAQGITDDPRVTGLVGPSNLIGVKHEDVKKIVSGAQVDCGECGDNWFELTANQAIILTSNLVAPTEDFLPDTDARRVLTIAIHIDGIGDGKITASLLNTDEAATVLPTITTEQIEAGVPSLPSSLTPVDDSGRIQFSNEATTPLALIWIVIVCMGAALLALAIKSWKK